MPRLRKHAWVDTCNLVFGAPFKAFAISTGATALAIYLPRILANQSADKMLEALISLGWAVVANAFVFSCVFLLHFFYLTPKRPPTFVHVRLRGKKKMSGQRESNPHGQLGRLELYH